MVFAGLYPTDTQQYEHLRDALDKLLAQRCVAALPPRNAQPRWALDSCCGFLGLLHMEIVQERLRARV